MSDSFQNNQNSLNNSDGAVAIEDQITVDDIKDISNCPSSSKNDKFSINPLKYSETYQIKENKKKKSNFQQTTIELPTEDNENPLNPIIIPSHCQFCKFVGHTLFVFIDKMGNPLFIIGPHWPMFVCFLSLMSALMFLIYYNYWKYYHIVVKIIGTIVYFIFALSYSYTSLINPGYPKNTIGRAYGIPRTNYYFCEFCRFWLKKCSYSTHCYDCHICIEGHDHHCPWTGHCIGKNNLISFYIFVTSAFILPIYMAFAFYIGLTHSDKDKGKKLLML